MATELQVEKRKTEMMGAFELSAIKSQLDSLMAGSPQKLEKFKTRILKISLNYGLDKCSPESVINCGLQALTLDMPLEQGQGYIVAYKSVATFDLGYKGWQVLAKRAGYSVVADPVYSCDEFSQSGFGHSKEITFIPNFQERKGYDDVWSRQNLQAVVVSILDVETKVETIKVVEAGMIHKIVETSPSMQSDAGKKHSPHMNWAEQMFQGKAIKQVLSKFPIDITKGSELMEAIRVVNEAESITPTQDSGSSSQAAYPDAKFNENYPKWAELVRSGKNKATAIITKLTSSCSFSEDQMGQLMELQKLEIEEATIIEGDKTDA